VCGRRRGAALRARPCRVCFTICQAKKPPKTTGPPPRSTIALNIAGVEPEFELKKTYAPAPTQAMARMAEKRNALANPGTRIGAYV